jgi:hypothetical protein
MVITVLPLGTGNTNIEQRDILSETVEPFDKYLINYCGVWLPIE